jgi:hypothetical protein
MIYRMECRYNTAIMLRRTSCVVAFFGTAQKGEDQEEEGEERETWIEMRYLISSLMFTTWCQRMVYVSLVYYYTCTFTFRLVRAVVPDNQCHIHSETQISSQVHYIHGCISFFRSADYSCQKKQLVVMMSCSQRLNIRGTNDVM